MKSASAPVALETIVGDGDDLQRRRTAGLQPLAQDVEVGRPVRLANRLEHLDRDDAVVGAADVAVILQPDVDAIGKAGLVYPLAGKVDCSRETVSAVTRQP